MPAAFIPICAYQGKLLGSTRPELNFTPCDLFEPNLLQNQLCYSLNFTKTKRWTTKSGSENGLLLVIDQEASLTEEKKHEDRVSKLEQALTESFGQVFIHTLSRFKDFRAGSYMLNSLKKMKGTTQFLQLTNEKKECQIETFEKCEQRKLLERITQQCHYVPWVLSSDFKVK